MKRKSKDKLFSQYLENISREALEKYQHVIRKYVEERHGIYALFMEGRLYYVGLASNLRSRLRHHLHDRHADTWDSFSVYFTVSEQHLRELEALLIRISKPKGNSQMGKFKFADNLCGILENDFSQMQKIQRMNFFCKNDEVIEHEKKAQGTHKVKGRTPTLSEFIKGRIHIRMRHKGKLYIAHARKDGTIKFAAESAEFNRLKDKVFTSPSVAARAVAKHHMNGWRCWTYERSPGEWVPLDELRKRR